MKKISDGIFGVVVGDAFGVPYEFLAREEVKEILKEEMVGFGAWSQPKGSWSDDSSLTLCLAESLINGFDLKNIAEKFINWKTKNLWTASGEWFDIGYTTSYSIDILIDIFEKEDFEALEFLKNEPHEKSNGNGALMRILPTIFYIKGENIKKQFEIIWLVSALTHPHIRSAISCLIYLKFIEKIILGKDKFESYKETQTEILEFFEKENIQKSERKVFEKILNGNIYELEEQKIKSSGYVVNSLEASFWCFLNSNSYKETILKSVSLGGDTDTVAAIAGGIAGIYFGYENIPESWRESILKKNEIEDLCKKLEEVYGKNK